jgi:hypothetical protein
MDGQREQRHATAHQLFIGGLKPQADAQRYLFAVTQPGQVGGGERLGHFVVAALVIGKGHVDRPARVKGLGAAGIDPGVGHGGIHRRLCPAVEGDMDHDRFQQPRFFVFGHYDLRSPAISPTTRSRQNPK